MGRGVRRFEAKASVTSWASGIYHRACPYLFRQGIGYRTPVRVCERSCMGDVCRSKQWYGATAGRHGRACMGINGAWNSSPSVYLLPSKRLFPPLAVKCWWY